MMSGGVNSIPIKSERAYVVYDGKSGAILHVHYVTTFEGAKDSSAKADRTQALSVAQQFGHCVEDAKVIAANVDELQTAHCVDVKSKRLVCHH